MPVKKLKKFLDDHNIKYVAIKHSVAYTAQEVASTVGISGKELAKTVIVTMDGRLAMAVLPASYRVDFGLLKNLTGAKTLDLASEDDFKDVFPDCDVGAMPPFGNLYGVPVYVAESLAEDEEIAFNACTHTELIKMSYKDFETLVQPHVLKFSLKR